MIIKVEGVTVPDKVSGGNVVNSIHVDRRELFRMINIHKLGAWP